MNNTASADYAHGAPSETSPLAQSFQQQARFNEEFDASQRGSSILEGEEDYRRADSAMSQSQTLTPSRGGTLKKKHSLKRGSSLRRSSSRRSVGAGSVKSLGLGDREKYEGGDVYSAFFTPVPTKGSPTEILANRFQDWRKVLKDLISYFREVQKSHEARSKSLLGLSNLASNLQPPPGFLVEGGIGEATKILKNHHKQSLQESNKAKGIEDEIMAQLTGLRNDLAQKIKEIKNLSGDFKNSVDKETDGTRKAVKGLQEALEQVDHDPSATSGKGDPYIIRLGVERQIERQIDEENYLHKAFLNLEHSGRELESIVVGEIQKAYNAYAGILKREADEAYETVDSLRTGPIMMAKDNEWDTFVSKNEHFVDPRMSIRKPEQVHYPGKDAPAAAEVRAGMLERKSKYLKSYTAGWYVLSPTHLHEFKSADHLNAQQPVMSLYLQEQKLGSHSNNDSSSHKFMLKGRQAGGMHRGHGWVFRAESRDTMLAWYEDIKNLTEKTGYERDAFVRRHARSVSGGSYTGSVSSDGGVNEEDDADKVPYSANPSQLEESTVPERVSQRPSPGGRFPSDVNIQRLLVKPMSPSSGSSDDREAVATSHPSNNQETYQSHEPREYPVYGQEDTRAYPTYEERYVEGNTGNPGNPGYTNQDYSQSYNRGDDLDQTAVAGGAALAGGAIAGTGVYYANREPATDPHVQNENPISPMSVDSQRDSILIQPPGQNQPGISTTGIPFAGAAATQQTAPEALATNSQLTPALTPQDGLSSRMTSTSALSDSTVESQAVLSRPKLPVQQSDITVSNLHVPGEFP